MHEENYWQAVLARDHTYDGAFVFAVRSTGIYCNPSCPSRRPKREQVLFFSWTFRLQETFRIDKRINLIVGRCATATLLVTRIGPHPAEQHHKWQWELHGVCLPG